MNYRSAIACTFLMVACSRNDARRPGASGKPDTSPSAAQVTATASFSSDAGKIDGDANANTQFADAQTAEEQTNQLLAQIGDTSQYGPEELRVIRFVEEYLNRNDPKYTKNRKYLVYERESGWAVEVINMKVILEGGRDGGMRFHVRKKAGRLEVEATFGR